MMTPAYVNLVEHGTFLGYHQGSEVYACGGSVWKVDEYATPDGPVFDVCLFRGDASRLVYDLE